MHRSRLIPTLAALLAVSAAYAAGTYTDAVGEKHKWRIQSNHVMVWDEKPFVPTGGLFQVKSWSPKGTDEDLKSDLEALEKVSAAGVRDIYLQPTSGGITRVNPVYIQKVIDACEAQGLTYGISLSDGPRSALLGYQVLPSRYRQSVTAEGGLLRFTVPDIASAYYALTLVENGNSSGQVVGEGDADLVEEGARVTVPPSPTSQVLVLYPERIYPADKSPIPNLWGGMDEYRDRLLALFGKIKLGKGMRFFTDPLHSDIDLSGEAQQIVPTSREFSGEWAAFLQKRYKNTEDLVRAWRLKDVELGSFAEAAQLVPLFFNEKGFHAFYDRVKGKRYTADLAPVFWNDLDDFKTDTLRAATNDLSVALKRGIADVPVVVRSKGYNKWLAYAVDARRPDLQRFEFDGLGIDAYGKGESAAIYSGADVYSQANDSPKPLWLPVLATQESRVPETNAPGFTDQQSLYSLLDSLRSVGARGFYLDGVRVTDPLRKPYDLSAVPAQLGWLPGYAKQIEATGIATAAPPSNIAIFFPRQLTSLIPTPLEGGAWLLPTDSRNSAQFKTYHFGKAGRCYSMDDGAGTVFYLFNPTGVRQITLKVPPGLSKEAQPYWLPEDRGVRKKDTLTLTIGPQPVRLHRWPGLPIPEEAFAELSAEARDLVALAKQRKLPSLTIVSADYDRLKANFRSDNPDVALLTLQGLQRLAERLRRELQPFAWIEAEGLWREDGALVEPAQYTFDQVEERSGASGGRVLLVRERPNTGQTATATYEVNISQDGTYRLWVASSPDASFSLRLDGLPWGDGARGPRPQGKTFGSPPLIWNECGPMLLSRGSHKLEVRAGGPMALDALLLTPGDFVPNGPNRPPFLVKDESKDTKADKGEKKRD
ncbi:MAG: hypothetical protein QM758_29580 [Armatimonas sp.]